LSIVPKDSQTEKKFGQWMTRINKGGIFRKFFFAIIVSISLIYFIVRNFRGFAVFSQNREIIKNIENRKKKRPKGIFRKYKKLSIAN